MQTQKVTKQAHTRLDTVKANVKNMHNMKMLLKIKCSIFHQLANMYAMERTETNVPDAADPIRTLNGLSQCMYARRAKRFTCI